MAPLIAYRIRMLGTRVVASSALCKNGPSQLGSVQKWPSQLGSVQKWHSCKNCPHAVLVTYQKTLCKNGSPYSIPNPHVGNASCRLVGSVQKWLSQLGSVQKLPSQLGSMQKWPVTTRLCAKMALLRRLCAKMAPLITYQNLMLGA